MLVSVSLILMVGMSMGWLCQKCRLPSLLGMLATGMVLGPYVLNLLDSSILAISPELRKMALIIILTRAGLGLDTSGLKKLGRPAVLMCFVPASFELMGVLLLAPKLMGADGFRGGDPGCGAGGGLPGGGGAEDGPAHGRRLRQKAGHSAADPCRGVGG